MSDEFYTVGEDFETMGAMGQTIVAPPGRATATPRGAIVPRQVVTPGGQTVAPGAQYLPMPGRFTMPMLPSLVQQQALTEPRVRAIVREELEGRLPAWLQNAQVPGSPAAAELLSPLGLGGGTLTATSPSLTLQASPQRPFRGERLVIDVRRSTGAASVPVIVRALKVGENSQFVGSNGVPADVFRADAFGVRLAMSPATPGILIVLALDVGGASIPPGESIEIAAAIIGRAVWGPAGGS